MTYDEDVVPDAIIIACRYCGNRICVGDSACIYCFEPYSLEFWRDSSNWDEMIMPEFDNSNPAHGLVADFTENYNLCCDEYFEDCECDEEDKMRWADIKTEIDPSELEEAYAYNSPCSSCTHYYEPSCLTFRSWVVDYFSGDDIPGEIDGPCAGYQDFRNTYSFDIDDMQF